MSAIEKALLDATDQKPQKKGEDRQKYLLRLALAANDDLKDDEWDALEAEAGAQGWVTAAVKADNDDKELADFPDLEEEEVSEEQDEETNDDEAEVEEAADDDEEDVKKAKPNGKVAPKKITTKKKAPAKAAAKKTSTKKPPPAKKVPAKGGKKPISARRALKQMIIKKPSLSADDLMEQLKAKGYDPLSKLTVNTTRSETRDTIKLLNELGHTEIAL